jgi:hypothetical protein
VKCSVKYLWDTKDQPTTLQTTSVNGQHLRGDVNSPSKTEISHRKNEERKEEMPYANKGLLSLITTHCPIQHNNTTRCQPVAFGEIVRVSIKTRPSQKNGKIKQVYAEAIGRVAYTISEKDDTQ